MQASQRIRDALAQVTQLRTQAAEDALLGQALHSVKAFQAQRFAGTYPDLLAHATFAPSARFFLEELYSARDYSQRDAQFARMAGALERTFPDALVDTAVALAELHAATEALDTALALQWASNSPDNAPLRYLAAWRGVGQRQQRQWQLDTVVQIGQTLARLTRTPGLRLMLKLMRKPAELAGLGDLQRFLESGFDHFAAMARQDKAAQRFLDIIQTRESAWIERLFEDGERGCQLALVRTLGLAPLTDLGLADAATTPA
jgi:hypothetical protein